MSRDDMSRDAVLARSGLTEGLGAYRIAEALLDTADSPGQWLSVRELAAIGGVARTAIARVVVTLRAEGVPVKRRTAGRRDEAQYRVGAEHAAPLTAVQDPTGVAA